MENVINALRKVIPQTNFLDNSDFTNLVAQAWFLGAHGPTQYFADRWFVSGISPDYNTSTRQISFIKKGQSVIAQIIKGNHSGKK